MKATMKNSPEIVDILLTFGANPRLENANGETALSMACIQENPKICEKLLIARASVSQTDKMGRTPLIRAAKFNKGTQIIDILMKYNANIYNTDPKKNGVLHYAAKHAQTQVLQCLMKYGASPYVFNSEGQLPIDLVDQNESVMKVL